MPLIDKPLPDLRIYEGRNPRPSDFDGYWEQAIAELDATPPAPKLIPNQTLKIVGAECFDLWFTGVGGARVYAKYIRPAGKKGCPAVLQFHGYSANSGDWSGKLSYISQGIAVAALDCRGQGGRSQDNGVTAGCTFKGHVIRGFDDADPRKLLFRQIFLDTVQLARVIMAMPEIDSARVGSQGGSQGGALALVCAALEPRIKRVVSVFPFLCDYLRVWEMDLARDAFQELRDYFRWFDPLHLHHTEVFTKLGYIDVQFLAPRIKAQTLMLTGLMDTVCPPSTQFAAYNKMTCQKDVVIYPDFGHETLPGESDSTMNFMAAL